MVNFKMFGSLKFDREIDKNKHYFSPGGYEFIFNGQEVMFDFCHYEGSVDKDDPKILHFEVTEPDVDSFPDLKHLEADDFRYLDKITEFFVYTGEYDETEINPVAITQLGIEAYNESTDKYETFDYSDFDAVKNYSFDPLYTEAVEVCPHCEGENVYPNWDTQSQGYVATCKHCGKQIFLCDECLHDLDNPCQKCDWKEEGSINTCFRGKCRAA